MDPTHQQPQFAVAAGTLNRRDWRLATRSPLRLETELIDIRGELAASPLLIPLACLLNLNPVALAYISHTLTPTAVPPKQTHWLPVAAAVFALSTFLQVVPDYNYSRHPRHCTFIFIPPTSITSITSNIMTRSHKFTDRDHAGLVDGTAEAEQHLPRYFAKSGHADTDPTKTKKNGGGKGNWGLPGDEVDDTTFRMANPRRRSNSSIHIGKDFKTKFETIEAEPVFEEEIHGPMGADLDKQSTTSSSHSSKSIEEEDANHK